MGAGVASGTIRARRPRTRVAALAIAAAVVVGGGAGVFIHLYQTGAAGAASSEPNSARATPLQRNGLYGQATWAAGALRAPAITGLQDQSGHAFALSALHGQTVAMTFLDGRCGSSCNATLRSVIAAERAIPAAERPALLIVSASPADTPSAVGAAARRYGLPALGRWYWLTGTRAALARTWSAYRVQVGPGAGDGTGSTRAVYLIDRQGDQRAGFVYPFTSRFMASDMRKLAEEKG